MVSEKRNSSRSEKRQGILFWVKKNCYFIDKADLTPLTLDENLLKSFQMGAFQGQWKRPIKQIMYQWTHRIFSIKHPRLLRDQGFKGLAFIWPLQLPCRYLVSSAAVFWNITQRSPKRCVTCQKTAAKETSRYPAKIWLSLSLFLLLLSLSLTLLFMLLSLSLWLNVIVILQE